MARRKADKMAALAPPFPKRSTGKRAKTKKSETKTSVNPNIEGYTPKGAMQGGGSTTKQKSARAKRLAGMPV